MIQNSARHASFVAAVMLVVSVTDMAQAATDFLSLGKVHGQWFNATFTGRTPAGDKFEISEISANGYGKITSNHNIWEAYCNTDAMNDVRACTLKSDIESVSITFLKPDVPLQLCVTNTVMIVGRPLVRIDQGKPIEGSPGGCFSQPLTRDIIRAYKAGARIRMRTFHNSPNVLPVVDVELAHDVPAFLVACDLVRFLYERQDQTIRWPQEPRKH